MVVCVLAVTNFTSAETIRGIDIDFVTIGNAGNAADTQIMDNDLTSGYGSVVYNYRIGKYEITNAQWKAFTDVTGAPTGTPSDAYDQSTFSTGTQQPTSGISWYEAAQFCNYLTSGDKSLGAYQFGTDGSITVDRSSAVSAYVMVYVIPTENEWYKAAYFKHDGSGYSLFANGTDTLPTAGIDSKYLEDPIIGSPWNIDSGTQEQNGTFNMMGNVWEWNETLIDSYRGVRGGSYASSTGINGLYSSNRSADIPSNEGSIGDMGFRIAEIPEPATLILLTLGGMVLRRFGR